MRNLLITLTAAMLVAGCADPTPKAPSAEANTPLAIAIAKAQSFANYAGPPVERAKSLTFLSFDVDANCEMTTEIQLVEGGGPIRVKATGHMGDFDIERTRSNFRNALGEVELKVARNRPNLTAYGTIKAEHPRIDDIKKRISEGEFAGQCTSSGCNIQFLRDGDTDEIELPLVNVKTERQAQEAKTAFNQLIVLCQVLR